jgi:AcrR family transcriptional regulator
MAKRQPKASWPTAVEPTPLVWLRLAYASPRTRREMDRIVAAAVDLADQDGFEALTMRGLAARLGTGTTTLYRYVTGKEELLELMVDAVNGELAIPASPSDDWRADMLTIARGNRAQLLGHPWLASQLVGRPAIGPNTLRSAEFAFGAMATVTADRTAAAVIVNSLLNLVRGVVVGELGEAEAQRRTGLTEGEWQWSLEPYVRGIIQAGTHPQFAAAVVAAEDLSADEQFEFAVARYLDGVEYYLKESPD